MTTTLPTSSSTTTRLRIATRQSPLALWQAEYVKQQLEQHHPGIAVELLKFTTRGDKILDTPLAKIGGKGLFVKELEQALLAGEADIAVHSMKDVPMAFPEGLVLGVICPRETPFDALVSNRFAAFADLPQGAVVGTSSLRRQCQLRRLRPDLDIRDLRGNVGTRLAKLDAGEYDAIVLAAAGLKRLGLAGRIREQLAPELCLPAGGQGAVGIELRSNDPATAILVAPLACATTTRRVIAERALNHRLQGGCQVPIACFAVEEGDSLFLRGLVGSVDGSEILHAEARSPLADAEALGVAVADQLLAQGAGRILGQLAGTLPLSGLCVAVTRPTRQNDGLVQPLRANGAEVTAIPLLAIKALLDSASRHTIDRQLSALAQIRIAIFISQNAAEQALQALAERGIPWPDGIQTYAIGSATAAYLAQHGVQAISPTRMDSEGLLALEVLKKIKNMKVMIFRGLSGRETLAQALRDRGAVVEYCELYERQLPEGACQQWCDWLAEVDNRPALICINSTDTLKHLMAVDPEAVSRDNLILVVPGERVAQAARTAGFQRVLTATDALDESILHAALSWNTL